MGRDGRYQVFRIDVIQLQFFILNLFVIEVFRGSCRSAGQCRNKHEIAVDFASDEFE